MTSEQIIEKLRTLIAQQNLVDVLWEKCERGEKDEAGCIIDNEYVDPIERDVSCDIIAGIREIALTPEEKAEEEAKD